MPDWLQATPDGVVVSLHVQPRASRNEIIGAQGGALKIRLTSPPVEGAANKLCCEYIAKLCGLPKRDVVLIAGERSRQKRVLIRGKEAKAVAVTLAAHSRQPS